MKLVAFLQLYNELSNGNLIRCLENCKKWAQEIFIYDDCSTDGSYDVYMQYTDASHVIVGNSRNFAHELYHKQRLLQLTLASSPDWIGWIDGDTVLCKWILDNYHQFLSQFAAEGYDAIKVHNMNLWRHPAFYRLDNSFNDLWHVVFWRNNGKLNYQPSEGLHQQQFPKGLGKIGKLADDQVLIHYGFASELGIARKYLTYKSYGQRGWDLDRLVDEQTSFSLVKVPRHIYPEENLPPDYDTVHELSPITFNEYRQFDNWEDFQKGIPGTDVTVRSAPAPAVAPVAAHRRRILRRAAVKPATPVRRVNKFKRLRRTK